MTQKAILLFHTFLFQLTNSKKLTNSKSLQAPTTFVFSRSFRNTFSFDQKKEEYFLLHPSISLFYWSSVLCVHVCVHVCVFLHIFMSYYHLFHLILGCECICQFRLRHVSSIYIYVCVNPFSLIFSMSQVVFNIKIIQLLFCLNIFFIFLWITTIP